MSEPPRRGGPGDVRLAETLLVVDDEANVRALARDALVSLGYVVLETGDPQHALRLAKEQSIHLLVVSDYPGRRAGVAARPSA
jgi:DNA-binding response OmpR family regulator